jgi:type II secretory pathway pseudopilin PulG
MLVVVGVIGILMVLAVPALRGLSGTSGVAGATNTLLAHLDQARLAAIESGSTAYVGFPPEQFSASSDPTLAFSSFIIFRKKGPSDPAAAPDFISISRWVRLPKGTVLDLSEAQLSEEVSSASALIPQLDFQDVPVRVIAYDRFGSIKSGAPGMKITLGNGIVIPEGKVTFPKSNEISTFLAQRVIGNWIPAELADTLQ